MGFAPKEENMEENSRLSRRSFLAIATGAIGGFIGIALFIPGIAYIVGPAIQRQRTENWVRLGSTTKVEVGTPTLFRTTVERQTGWIVNPTEISVYILTENGRVISPFRIFALISVAACWIAEQQEFFCPCHNGVFSKDGAVVSGPPLALSINIR
jgi:Rieske Fe-S protein